MLLLNYRPVLAQPRGIGVYAEGVLPALRQLPHRLVQGGGSGGGLERLRRLAWTQVRLPRLAARSGASLIFTPAPEGYLGPQQVPQVVMVHDLRSLTHPEASLQSLYFRSWVPALLRSCRHVLTNSLYTAAEIIRATAIPESRISVVPLGYDRQSFRLASAGALPDLAGLVPPGAPYLLHVGEAYPHKNLERLIRAFERLGHLELRLVLAGKPHPTETLRLRRLVAERGLTDRVLFLPYVPFAQLPDLYRGALAFVYPSLWEGFGLPVLEAMACGTPVLTSPGSGLQEASGEAALLADPLSLPALTSALARLVGDGGLRARLRAAGLERSAAFSWERTGAQTRAVIEGLMG
ncbi:MAG: glycosyltransferase family 1 protein [Synechococcaceae cyanobacterium ELA445]